MSNEHFDLRKEEIVNACEKLYDEYNFKEITMKLISEKTTFSRPSIYNYFETKEEIFLALFKREYEKWINDLTSIYENNIKMTKEEFSKALASSIKNKERLLKLLSMNMYDLEENSRMDRLIDFKKSYGKAIKMVKSCLEKFFPEIKKEESLEIVYSFFAFMFGIYPYAVVTKKQKEAMQKAEIEYKYFSIYELTYMEIKKLLK